MIRAIIFDLDGVLVDATDWHFHALNRALSVFGYTIHRKEHGLLYNGLPTKVKLELLSQRKQLPRALHSFINELKQQYTRQTILSTCSADIKVSAMLRHLKAQGYKLGIATNAIRSTLELVVEKMAIRSYFDCLLSNEDVAHAKPSSEIYLKMMEQLNTPPQQCLIIEDSLPGIQAASASKAHVHIVTGTEEVALDQILEQINRIRWEKEPPPADSVSTESLEIIIPMAGLGQRFMAAGYKHPKPLIPIHGKPMIQWVVENIRPQNQSAHFTFLCNQQHSDEYNLPDRLYGLSPGCAIVEVANVTEGAACTVLLAIEHIDHNRALLLVNSDQWVDTSIDAFLSHAKALNVDGLIMTFPDTNKKWSFAETDEMGRVKRVAEKEPISHHATVGIYYFKRAGDFFRSAMDMIRKDIRTNGEFYVCPVYNEMIAQGKNIRIFEIPSRAMHGLGTPEDLERFIEKQSSSPLTQRNLSDNQPCL